VLDLGKRTFSEREGEGEGVIIVSKRQGRNLSIQGETEIGKEGKGALG